jgi:hypothetical protein
MPTLSEAQRPADGYSAAIMRQVHALHFRHGPLTQNDGSVCCVLPARSLLRGRASLTDYARQEAGHQFLLSFSEHPAQGARDVSAACAFPRPVHAGMGLWAHAGCPNAAQPESVSVSPFLRPEGRHGKRAVDPGPDFSMIWGCYDGIKVQRAGTSAPNPKFAHQLLRVRLRTSGSKGALES